MMAVCLDDSTRSILHQLKNDFEFGDLRQAFLATGRGRRKEVSQSLDNKLLLHVFLLKEEGGKSWLDAEAFIKKVVGKNDVPKDRLRTLTEKAVKEANKQTLQTFETFLCREVDLDGIGKRLTAAGFTKASLFDSTYEVRESMPSNGLLIELGRFQQKHNLSNETLLNWFCRLTGVSTTLPPGTATKFKKWVNSLTTQLKKLQSNKGKKDGAAALEKFLDDPFVIPGMFRDCEPEKHDHDDESCNDTTAPTQNLGGLYSQLSMLRRQLQERENECQFVKEKVNVITEEKKTTFNELQLTTNTNAALVQQLIVAKTNASQLKQECCALQAELKTKNLELISMKKENVAKRLKRMNILNANLISALKRSQKSKLTRKRAQNKRLYRLRSNAAACDKRQEKLGKTTESAIQEKNPKIFASVSLSLSL